MDAQATEGSTIGLFANTRQDVDYQLNTLGASASLITPAGLFQCKPRLLRGETRIDSFNNIIGISDVRNAEWKDFSAHDLECRYGAKWQGFGGSFKAGIGLRDYLGKTDDEPGGKHISIEGAGALIAYDSDHLDVNLSWQRAVHDYTLQNQSSFIDYNSLIDFAENTTQATVKYRHLYLHATHLSGNKDNVYTTPIFPANSFEFDHTDFALGIALTPESDGLTLIAPVFGSGSYRGSFNPLEGDDLLKGIELAGRVKGVDIELTFVRHDGEGNRPYLPATENLTEKIKSNRLSIGIGWEAWRLTVENVKSNHKANARIADPLYAAILGGFGPYNNKRDEDKWTISLSMPVVRNITADLSFYHTTREDQQYNHPQHNYIERGGSIHFKMGV
ncbi:MAG: hypothetical protein N0E54_05795 [Candidatus Thiodiazotropha taylori]|nr:hypothetical protein [Candidatus Thiodiazotropha endolucinida]MCW4228235.1 hypothetical protein [Candidatus Thiodiazotropha taylori]